MKRKIGSMHILLAEDNDANRLIARSILERDGHTVFTVPDGLAALAACRIRPYDAILLDIMMPGMDGVKTLRRIKMLESANAIVPIFALTAFCSPADQTRYLRAGFDSVLPKPLRSGQFDKHISLYVAGETSVPTAPPNAKANMFTNTTLIDIQIIAQLRDIGDTETIGELIQSFWHGIKESLRDINRDRHLVLQGDPQAISRFRSAVHAIKGSTASIGLSRASHIARSLQNAPAGDTPELLRQLCACLAACREPLSRALSVKAPPLVSAG